MVGQSALITFGVSNIAIPPKGPKVVPMLLDFSVQTSIDVSGELVTAQGHIDYVQGFYVDNAIYADPVSFTIQGTDQNITVPPFSQGYFPALFLDPPNMVVETTALTNKIIDVILYNVPIQAQMWCSSEAGAGLTDAQLRAAPIEVVPSGGAYTDRSIANLTGASQALMAANADRKILVINNVGATSVAVNLTGGAAVIGGAGSITLLTNGTLVLDSYPPTGIINIIGTLNADVTAYEA